MSYLLTHLPGLVAGAVRGVSAADLTVEIQPSLYWLAAPFFATVLGSRRLILQTATLVRISGVLLALVYLATLVGLFTGHIDFVDLYAKLDATGEFFFRGESYFFYKGFLYLAIACVFLLAMPGRWSGSAFAVVAIALVLTLTRGFVVATAVAVLLMLMALRRWWAVGAASTLTAVALLAVWVVLPGLTDGFSDEREISNSVRIDDLCFMLDQATPATLLIGKGFGAYINGRLNIENTYLWILWKLGLPALLFWLVPLVLCISYMRSIGPRHPDHRLACGYFYATVLVYVQTATNPYLNNPIGLSFVLIALSSLRTLAAGTASRRVAATGASVTSNRGAIA